MNIEEMMITAANAAKNAYAPYSNFHVGAALLTKDNKLFIGCNVENNGIQSICAERCAFIKAISEGYTKNDFKCIFVAAYKENPSELKDATPCGYCREFMSEFVDKDFEIYCYNNQKLEKYYLSNLLPHSFR